LAPSLSYPNLAPPSLTLHHLTTLSSSNPDLYWIEFWFENFQTHFVIFSPFKNFWILLCFGFLLKNFDLWLVYCCWCCVSQSLNSWSCCSISRMATVVLLFTRIVVEFIVYSPYC
jgi:hypothetical protein